MIHFDNVTKRYAGGHEALRGVNLHLGRGELVFITGHSGAGKSTLLKLIALIERPTTGQIVVDSQNYVRVRLRQIPQIRRRIGIVFQNPTMLYDRSVYDNVALPLLIAGYRKHDVARRVRAALDKVGLLKKENMNPVLLSGGEQQRVGIARAVVAKPDILLADEPTGNLDADLAWEIMSLFAQFQQVGVTVMIASHDLGLVERLPYRQLPLKNGALAESDARVAAQ